MYFQYLFANKCFLHWSFHSPIYLKCFAKTHRNEHSLRMIKFQDIYFNKSGNKLQVTFNQIMKKLPNQYLSGSALDPYNQVLVESLVDCLEKDDSCNATWRQLFHKCSKQSATLLEYIGKTSLINYYRES